MNWDDDSGYDLNDPKHPTYAERVFAASDNRRKREREDAEDWKRVFGPDHNADEASERYERDHAGWDQDERSAA